MNFIATFESFKKRLHTLSGIILLLDNKKVLLVQPRKFRRQKNKWSIPKGHIEGNSYESALKELEEETGIRLSYPSPDKKLNVKYKKGKFKKHLTSYLITVDKEDIKDVLIKNTLEIDPKNFDRKEISKAKFFDIDVAYSKLEKKQRPLLKKLVNLL